MERHHIAVFPANGSGHVNPMLELSRRLIPLGFTVSFLLPEDTHAAMMSRPQEENIQLVSITGASSQSQNFLSPELIEDQVVDVLNPLQPRVECLISDSFIGWSQDVANKLKIPRVAFWCSNTSFEAVQYYLPLLASKGFYPLKDDPGNSTTLITFLPGFSPFHPSQLPLAFRKQDCVTIGMALGDALRRMKEALCVLTNAIEELEQELVAARRSEFSVYLPVGPLIPDSLLRDHGVQESQTENDLCIRWLNKQACGSVLYIAFGSVVKLGAHQVQKIADALEASGKLFLWAIRQSCVPDAPEDLVESLRGRFGEQGLIVEWAPQGAVLGHLSTGAYLMHCGWNSTLEAICSGVPLLCWPCENEQNMICFSIVEQWKIGMKIAEGPNDPVTVKTIEMAIQEMMEGDQGRLMRSRVQILQETARNTSHGGCSQKNLVKLKELILNLPSFALIKDQRCDHDEK